MSTIVAARKAGVVCIAADTLTCLGETKQASIYERSHDKIYRFNDNRIGIVGSAAHHMVIQSLLNDPAGEYRLDSRIAIFESFRKMHPILKERYYLNPKEADEDAYESSRIDALIVNPRGLFAVFSLREVFEYTRFWAIGSGADFALGAMFAAYDERPTAEEIARVGVEAGATFDTGSALPMSAYTLALSDPEGE